MRNLIALALLASFVSPASAYEYGRYGQKSLFERRQERYKQIKARQAETQAEARASAADSSAKAAKAHADAKKDQMRGVLDKMSQNNKSVGIQK